MQLKDFFDRSVVTAIARALHAAHPPLVERTFIAQCLAGLEDLELTARGAHIAATMRAHLPAAFPAAVRVLLAALDFELPRASSMAAFRYLPFTQFVSSYGLEHFADAMRAQRALTRVFSAEFSIRPFLVAHPARTLAQLATWARDPDEHVRRLVSEGTRPRLPWGSRLQAFIADPAPVLALLELLRDDPARYVQRSVANNLNDIAKDHPALVVETCRRWLVDAPPARRWIVGHALRSLVKRGDRDALALLGAGATPEVELRAIELPARVAIGDSLAFAFELASTSRAAEPQALVVDYAVHFIKANGAASPKVFKLRRVELARGAAVRLAGRVSFAQHTTRTPYPGRHLLDARINGEVFPLGSVDVRAKR